jgi:hypothetical protein
MRETAAQNATQGIPNLLIRGIGFCVENGLRCQDYATEAEPALGRSFLNKRLLDWVRLFGRAQAFQRGDFVLTNCTDRHDTRPHDLAAHDYSAGSALSHSTSESRSTQLKLVVQNKQQWRFWIDFHEVLLAVHIQGDLLPHRTGLLLYLCCFKSYRLKFNKRTHFDYW